MKVRVETADWKVLDLPYAVAQNLIKQGQAKLLEEKEAGDAPDNRAAPEVDNKAAPKKRRKKRR